MDDRWLSLKEIAEYLGARRETIYKWIEKKGMPGHQIGRNWKFKKEEVDPAFFLYLLRFCRIEIPYLRIVYL